MYKYKLVLLFFFFQAEDGIRDDLVTGVQTCALPIWGRTIPWTKSFAILVIRVVRAFHVDTSSVFVDRAAAKLNTPPVSLVFDATQMYPLASRMMNGISTSFPPEMPATEPSVPHVIVVPLIVPRRTVASL